MQHSHVVRVLKRPVSNLHIHRFSSMLSPATMSPAHVKMLSERVLSSPDGVNSALKNMDYAVRGDIVIRAAELRNELRSPDHNLTFDKIVYCNIGNPQSVGQSPITFVRQVLAGITCPSLIKSKVFPSDVCKRVEMIMDESHGVGAYTESKGLEIVRKRVAKAIEKRDGGIPSDFHSIFLTNGASDAAKMILNLMVRNSSDGIMVPIPQYPLYSATMTALGGSRVDYFLNEDKGWSLDMKDLEIQWKNAKDKGVDVRGIVVINPGNPTGQVLTEKNIQDIVQFCEEKRMVILADEVYQKNVYVPEKPFVSFKKVVSDLGSNVELISFHSVSKGVLGECGLRGGYMELVNIDEEVHNLIYKVASVSLCSNAVGQVAIDIMMSPPNEDEPSYKQYQQEVAQVFNSLKKKAIKLADALNTFDGVSCNPSEGAMYLFPQITVPEKAISLSKKMGFASPDVLYCKSLLEETGICVVPGSGFGQKEGTYHFRTTFLPEEEDMVHVIEKMRTFHQQFMKKYS